MKTSRFVFLTILGFILLAPFYSCKHKVETVMVPTWKGRTLQNLPVTLTVENVDTGLFITLYDFYVKNDSSKGPDSILRLTRSSANGMGSVVNNKFRVPIAHVNADLENVSGTFDSTKLTIAGNIMVIFKTPPDTVRETYTASKQK